VVSSSFAVALVQLWEMVLLRVKCLFFRVAPSKFIHGVLFLKEPRGRIAEQEMNRKPTDANAKNCYSEKKLEAQVQSVAITAFAPSHDALNSLAVSIRSIFKKLPDYDRETARQCSSMLAHFSYQRLFRTSLD